MKNFPFKHLIWALVAIVALFLFRSSWEHIIMKMEEVTIFGSVNVKVSQKEFQALTKAEKAHKKEQAELESQIAGQDKLIASLSKKTKRLSEKVSDCNEAKGSAKEVMDVMKELNINATIIKQKSRVLDTEVVRMGGFRAAAIPPSGN